MEAPFYHDEAVSAVRPGSGSYPRHPRSQTDEKSASSGAAEPPEPTFLRLASPELHRLMTAQASGRGSASGRLQEEEQERLSQGLVKGRGFVLQSGNREQEDERSCSYTLQDLQKQNQLLILSGTTCSPHTSTSVYHGNLHLTQARGGDLPVYTNNTYNPSLSSMISGTYSSTATIPCAGRTLVQDHLPASAQPGCPKLQEQPQIVPEVGPVGESPPLSPIDLGNQDQIKAERKRLRNRIAASNCRRRKLERISRLENKVKSLKSENSELTSTATVLREQVVQLKHKVMNHVTNGCQLVLTTSSLLKPEENARF
ncbi:transcription factor jun-D [Callorhinchus milii]|uniref:Transcription factor jun-D n=1 Tax=Callorhinchus milii TaxID=7868 RepID=V9KI85_CALMI|nr:transcription factor jun-D [Callorhinchus milii]|eukprot:gi/632949395/ref/XP_007890134.1/ PREDICTED: transcription factor jun-D-like [Callorhinchus milii]